MTQPLISVLIPCYNAARWLGDTLQSLVDQHYDALQVIVVDDGSSDDSSAIVASWQSRFRDLQLIRQKNRGKTAALNVALAQARGDYVQYLDADDVLMPGKLHAQLARLQGHPDCVAMAAWGRFHDVPANTRFDAADTWQDLAPVDWLVADWADGGGMMFPAMWLAPMGLIRAIGPWREDLSLLDDMEYFSRLLLMSTAVLFCPEAKVGYRSGISGSLSGLKSRAAFLSGYQVLLVVECRLLAREDSDRTRRILSVLWQRFAHGCYAFFRDLAEESLARAERLHFVVVIPAGGRLFHRIAAVIGWRLTSRMQNFLRKKCVSTREKK